MFVHKYLIKSIAYRFIDDDKYDIANDDKKY